MNIDQLCSRILESKSLDDLKLRIQEQRMKDRIQQAADNKWEQEMRELAGECQDA